MTQPELLPRGRGRRQLVLMLLCCAAPVLAAWLSYALWPPQGGHSYGRLLAQPLPVAQQQGWPQGRWVLLSLGDGCDAVCAQRRFAMRQIQTAQGEAASRMVRAHRPAVAGLRSDGFYLVDPLGNAVLFYADGSEPRQVISEIARVLKMNNGIG